MNHVFNFQCVSCRDRNYFDNMIFEMTKRTPALIPSTAIVLLISKKTDKEKKNI